jgi:hypothetical protein
VSDLKTELSDVKSLAAYFRGLPDNVIPSEEELRAVLNRHLVVTGVMSREVALSRTAKLIMDWFHRFGSQSTATMVETFLVKRSITTVRRIEDNGKPRVRDVGSQNQCIDVPAATGVAERPEERGGEERSVGRRGLQVLEGGKCEGSAKGDQLSECTSGSEDRRVDEDGVSRRLVLLELAEHEEDLKVFQKAYNGIRARVRTVEDEGRLMKLATWSGTTATLGLLELVVHNIERVIAELKEIVSKIDGGIIPNLDEE